MITDKNLLQLYRMGFLPGPEENEEQFLRRVERTKEFSQGKEKISLPLAKKVQDLFHITPQDFVRCFDNKKLSFWEGGATFFYEDIPLIRLSKKKWLSFLYPIEEIASHELIHAIRAAFQESRFEEFFAYLTSKRSYRRYFGPLFSHTLEPWVLIFALFLTIALFNPLFLSLTLLFFLFRLFLRQRIFHNCLKRLKNTKNPLSIALCLTDKEILHFAKQSQEKIKQLLQGNQDLSPRWRLIRLLI